MAQDYKEYILMHQDTNVIQLTLDQTTGAIASVGTLFCKEHLPVGIPVRRGIADRSALNDWWIGRSIPASRSGIRHLLDELHISAPQKLLEKCFGLSLSDAYWIRPADTLMKWADVNFYENPFSEDVGDILFGGGTPAKLSLLSPDNTSDGWLRKKWIIENQKRYLVKGGSGTLHQEPYNEVIASRIMERLGIPHVRYELRMLDGLPYSICEDFITPDTEYIPAWYLMHTFRKPNHISLFTHYMECCRTLGLKDAGRSVSQQITIDYLLVNEDRHQGNFGAVRRADTLEYIGAAPVFDTGSSLWFETPTPLIRATSKSGCKPFKTTHEEQLKLVTDFSWLDEKQLSGLGDIVRETFSGSAFVDSVRSERIAGAVEERARMLLSHIRRQTGFHDDISNDVRKNIAFSRQENP
ncbi:MAG: excisionase [Eisenbergiella sp.]